MSSGFILSRLLSDCCRTKWVCRRTLLIVLLITGIMIPGYRCRPEFGVDKETLKVIGDAIEALEEQPGQWEAVLAHTIELLGEVGTESAKAVIEEVENVITMTMGDFRSTVFCTADYAGIRARQYMEELLHRLDKDAPEASIQPIICNASPDVVSVEPEVIVHFDGFDFSPWKTDLFIANIEYYDTKEVAKKRVGAVALESNYQLTVKLRAEDFAGLDFSRDPQLVLRWQDERFEGKSTLNIEDPPKPSATSVPYGPVGQIGPFGGPYGDWTDLQMCPHNQWAFGFSLKLEDFQGPGDDTALNGIRLMCGSSPNTGHVTEISSGEGPWGNWFAAEEVCEKGYLASASLRIEPPQGDGDDAGAIHAEFKCQKNGTEVSVTEHHGWGIWQPWQGCPDGTAICGIRTRVESDQGGGDDTALNDAIFVCCAVP